MKSFEEYYILVAEAAPDGTVWTPGYADADAYMRQLGREKRAALAALGRITAVVGARLKPLETLIEETKPPGWKFWTRSELQLWGAAKVLGEKGHGHPSARESVSALLEESSDDLVSAGAESLAELAGSGAATETERRAASSRLLTRLQSPACGHVIASPLLRALGILQSAPASAEEFLRAFRKRLMGVLVGDDITRGPRARWFDAQRAAIWNDFALERISADPSTIPQRIFVWVDPTMKVGYTARRRCDFDGAAHIAGTWVDALEASTLLGPPTPETLAAIAKMREFVDEIEPSTYPPKLKIILADALSSFDKAIAGA